MREAIQQMTECRDPAEMLHIQQDWLSGALRRASDDVTMLNERITSMTQKATTDFEKAARKVAEPLYAVSADSDEAAQAFRFDGAQYSDMMSPRAWSLAGW